MNVKWHKLNLMCATCNEEPSITEVLTSADGEIGFNMYCPKCQKECYYLTTGAKLIHKSLILDIMEVRQIKPVKPPLKKKEDHRAEDHDFLKGLGIDDEK